MFKYIKFTKVETDLTVLEFRGGDETVKVNHFDREVVSIETDNEADIDALVDAQATEIGCELITQDEYKTIVKTTTQFARIKKQVDDKYTKDVGIVTSLYPAVERETWATQLSQANAYKVTGDELDAPFLKTLADAENDTVKSFADAVITKANEYEVFMAQTLATKRAFEKNLMQKIGL